jgi:hypothetical protein
MNLVRSKPAGARDEIMSTAIDLTDFKISIDVIFEFHLLCASYLMVLLLAYVERSNIDRNRPASRSPLCFQLIHLTLVALSLRSRRIIKQQWNGAYEQFLIA